MITLGIETSCDETAVALYDNEKGIIAEEVFSQIDIHKDYGGVVPELASRDHCAKIMTVTESTLKDFSLDQVDQISYTAGPGLIGALLIGENFAQGLALGLNKPIIPVNHLEAHLHAPRMSQGSKIGFPFLTLLVSGGHTMIIEVKSLGDYELLGETRDDAAGEAFDKVASLLGLNYPGGPALEKLAEEGDSSIFQFPRPMMNTDSLDMSFSGLKTSVLYELKKITDPSPSDLANMAASFQEAATDVLIRKIEKAFDVSKSNCIVLAGGVAANTLLRDKMTNLSNRLHVTAHYPPIKHCTDNAAMIAYLGSLYSHHKHYHLESYVRPRWPLNEISK